LITNNPREIANLTQHGAAVNGCIPLIIPPNPYNEFHLQAKAARCGPLLDLQGKSHLQEQSDHPIIDGMSTELVLHLHRG
jgi:hypothetical protein